jgi:hypothetical protein
VNPPWHLTGHPDLLIAATRVSLLNLRPLRLLALRELFQNRWTARWY